MRGHICITFTRVLIKVTQDVKRRVSCLLTENVCDIYLFFNPFYLPTERRSISQSKLSDLGSEFHLSKINLYIVNVCEKFLRHMEEKQ